jgi:hypothetical protein
MNSHCHVDVNDFPAHSDFCLDFFIITNKQIKQVEKLSKYVLIVLAVCL